MFIYIYGEKIKLPEIFRERMGASTYYLISVRKNCAFYKNWWINPQKKALYFKRYIEQGNIIAQELYNEQIKGIKSLVFEFIYECEYNWNYNINYVFFRYDFIIDILLFSIKGVIKWKNFLYVLQCHF